MTKRKTHEQIVLNEKTLQAILTLQESLTKYGLDIKQYDRFEIVEKHGFIGVTVLNTKLMSQFPGPLDPEARKKIGVRVIVNSEDQSLVGVISLEGAEIRKVK